MKKLILNATNYATYGYIIAAILVWLADYFQIDLTALFEATGLPADFFGTTGLVALGGKTTYTIARYILTKVETRTSELYRQFTEGMGMVGQHIERLNGKEQVNGDLLRLVETSLLKVMEFEKILANKNLQSEILDDATKDKLRTWLNDIESLKAQINENL